MMNMYLCLFFSFRFEGACLVWGSIGVLLFVLILSEEWNDIPRMYILLRSMS